MTKRNYIQFAMMMFFNFFVWGLWFVTMGTYLTKQIHKSDEEAGLAYGTQALGAILAPFIIGMIADKFFSAQKVLGVVHIFGAVLLYFLSRQEIFFSFYTLLLLYFILFMPTLALVNAIAMNKMDNPEKEFGGVRVWGTIGWIAAGLLVGYLGFESQLNLQYTFQLAAIFSVLLGFYSFTLPETPPRLKGKQQSFKEMLGLDALRVLKDKNYLIFFISSMLICIPLAFYYQEANKFLNELGVEKAAGKMTMGQMSETIFLFALPLFFRFLNIKKMLLIGMLAWVLRYLLFAYGDVDTGVWMLYGGIILHGVCYDFFFVTGQIYTDQKSPIALRSSSQGLITLATYGVGMLIGFSFAGNITASYQTEFGQHDWQAIWTIPAMIAGVIFILFMWLFKNEKQK